MGVYPQLSVKYALNSDVPMKTGEIRINQRAAT